MGGQVQGPAQLVLAPSMLEAPGAGSPPGYASLRYAFRPGCTGISSAGFLRVQGDNQVTVQAPDTTAQFAGKLEPCKGLDFVARFDGRAWQLELLSANINTRFVRGGNGTTALDTLPGTALDTGNQQGGDAVMRATAQAALPPQAEPSRAVAARRPPVEASTSSPSKPNGAAAGKRSRGRESPAQPAGSKKKRAAETQQPSSQTAAKPLVPATQQPTSVEEELDLAAALSWEFQDEDLDLGIPALPTQVQAAAGTAGDSGSMEEPAEFGDSDEDMPCPVALTAQGPSPPAPVVPARTTPSALPSAQPASSKPIAPAGPRTVQPSSTAPSQATSPPARGAPVQAAHAPVRPVAAPPRSAPVPAPKVAADPWGFRGLDEEEDDDDLELPIPAAPSQPVAVAPGVRVQHLEEDDADDEHLRCSADEESSDGLDDGLC